MAVLRRPRGDNSDEFDTTEGGNYLPTTPPAGAGPVTAEPGPTSGGGANGGPGGGATPPPPGTPPPPPGGGYDRTQFRDAWMSSSGSLDDFIKNNPQFATGVTTGGSKGDLAYLPSGEIMDLQIAKGVNGNNALHGWTGVGQTGPGGQQTFYPPTGGGTPPVGGQSPAPGAIPGAGGTGNYADIFSQLQKLYPNGMFNQDVVNRRTENAAENLRRFQGSQKKNDEAYLADRGLIGSGPQQTANSLLDQNVANSYQNAVSGIYADQSQQADARMMQALQTAAGLTGSQAQNAVDWYNAQSGRSLGQGQLALGAGNLDLNRSLGMGNLALGNQKLGLDGEQLQWMMDHGDMQQLIDAYNQLYHGADVSAGGHR